MILWCRVLCRQSRHLDEFSMVYSSECCLVPRICRLAQAVLCSLSQNLIPPPIPWGSMIAGSGPQASPWSWIHRRKSWATSIGTTTMCRPMLRKGPALHGAIADRRRRKWAPTRSPEQVTDKAPASKASRKGATPPSSLKWCGLLQSSYPAKVTAEHSNPSGTGHL